MSEAAIGFGVRDPQNRGEALNKKLASELRAAAEFGVQLVYLESNTPLGPGGEEIGAIRDMTGRFEQGSVPMLNEPAFRSLARDKLQLSQVIGADGNASYLLPEGEDALAVLRDIDPSDRFIIKPIQGNGAQGITVIDSPDDARGLSFERDMIVQPFTDTTHVPSSIEAIGDFYTELWGRQGVAKELRIYTHRDPHGAIDWYPVGRVSKHRDFLREDAFAILEPSSIPASVIELISRVTEKFAKESDVPYMYGAIDCFFDSETEEPRVMEVNVKEPVMPGTDTDLRDGEDPVSRDARVEAGKHTARKLVGQLIRLAAEDHL